MRSKQTREVAWPDPESFGQRIDCILVQCSGLDQGQSPLDGCLGALPCRTERRRFRAAAQAGPIAGTFRGGRAWIEFDIARQRSPHPANRAAVDSRRLDREEQYPVRSGVAPLHGLILSEETNMWQLYSASGGKASCLR